MQDISSYKHIICQDAVFMDAAYGPEICNILSQMAENGATVILAFEDRIYDRKQQHKEKENIGPQNVRITSDRLLGSRKHMWDYWYEMSREFSFKPEETLYITSNADAAVHPDSIGIDCLYDPSVQMIASQLKL